MSDLDKKCLIDVIASRTQEELIEALSQQLKDIREKVEEVCIDRWGGLSK